MHCMQTLCIHADRADSDHFPLCLELTSSESTQPNFVPSEGDPRKRLKWDKRCLNAYQAELVGSGCMRDMQSAMHSLHMRDGVDAASKFSEALLNIAKAAGMRMSNARSGAKRALSQQKPCFYSKCRQLKASVQATRAAGAAANSPELCQARAAFNKGARCKRR